MGKRSILEAFKDSTRNQEDIVQVLEEDAPHLISCIENLGGITPEKTEMLLSTMDTKEEMLAMTINNVNGPLYAREHVLPEAARALQDGNKIGVDVFTLAKVVNADPTFVLKTLADNGHQTDIPNIPEEFLENIQEKLWQSGMISELRERGESRSDINNMIEGYARYVINEAENIQTIKEKIGIDSPATVNEAVISALTPQIDKNGLIDEDRAMYSLADLEAQNAVVSMEGDKNNTTEERTTSQNANADLSSSKPSDTLNL